jgi:hypothetical protein
LSSGSKHFSATGIKLDTLDRKSRSTAANHVWLMIVLDTNIVAALMANGADIDLACKS